MKMKKMKKHNNIHMKNYNQFINENLLDELKGPSKEEVWNKIGRNFFKLEEIPDTIDEFLDYLFNNGTVKNITPVVCRFMFNNKCLFLVMKTLNHIYIYDRLYKIVKGFYNINLRDFNTIIHNRLEEKFGKFKILDGNISTIED